MIVKSLSWRGGVRAYHLRGCSLSDPIMTGEGHIVKVIRYCLLPVHVT